ncbi:TldD/PmbA family protein [Metapseudomonas lalkuanensis]|uniref:TldD/PmbA family protein n=1 Tax=Metapseudomonas lalkuanensis TaxID=2604832 RepID=A0A5J6QJJ9_9GAMM|nr:TldD/PmbA family protein [Pseudomonas lalkuanensis]QEY62750.1 TldD/PmbA family protein [Pseudomonas lalkuanensis]
MFESFRQRFAALATRAEFHSLRVVRQTSEQALLRRGVAEPPSLSQDMGAMLSVRLAGVEAYAATADLSQAGLQRALDQAETLARQIARYALIDQSRLDPPPFSAQYRSPGLDQPYPSLAERFELLAEESARIPGDPRLVNWNLYLDAQRHEQLYLNSASAEQWQDLRFTYPGISVTAFDGSDSQTRTFGGYGSGQQGGMEVLQRLGFAGAAARVADEALQLLMAPNAPSGTTDLLLMPDQMMLQIHESIGHPLELDRILGDERNYAGTSFIGLEDFGRYQYGSKLLNISFDPGVPEELASYSFDDDGQPARKEMLISDGLLLRPLGGALSQQRSGLPGVANSRASSWNRAPIDRMANLNLEPGDQSLAQLIGGIEHGVLMSTNRSWSIDDSRNKFQFGCEWGRVIENGELGAVVKNPNYRGVSAHFWRSLAAVGDASTVEVHGTPYCGKGEPNQVVRVGHASPACVFRQVEVFGGAQ